jgi:CBS domain-containing protein
MAALVGMAAMFSGASRALLASVVFAFEVCLQPEVLPALLAGATGAYLVSHLMMKYTIMTEKIARRGVIVPHVYEPDTLHHTFVSEVMTGQPQILPAAMRVSELAQRIGAHDPEVSLHQASLIVDEAGALQGIITRGDVLRAIQAGKDSVTILEAGSAKLVVTYADETLGDALAKMEQVGRLPVVERENPKKIVGYLGRSNIIAARLNRYQQDSVREPGWLASRKLATGQPKHAT